MSRNGSEKTESRIRWLIVFAAGALTALVLAGYYISQPIVIHQVSSSAGGSSEVSSSLNEVPVMDDTETDSFESEDNESGFGDVLVEKSIDINSAGVRELAELPGIGAELADRIVEYRETEGPFGSIEEIMNVKGIGESLYEDIEIYIYVEE